MDTQRLYINAFLGELAELVNLKINMKTTEATLVRQARENGASWAEIGKVYGVSRQAAHAKWAKVDKLDKVEVSCQTR